MTLSEATHRVIGLAREIYDYYATELPRWHPDYPLVRPGEEDPPPPPAEAELRGFLGSLPDKFIYQILLIMDLGRGFFGADALAENFEELKRTYRRPGDAISRMMGKAALADCLSDGLEELRARGIDVDEMPLKTIRSRGR